ncbi:MAG: HEAT repeat domain-containing protein [Phycisphaeraceae bacterium]|nr:HEAT repeat domain-containing protein [Phycisphaeraceae bacterium]MCW5764228.1 HEAT repeat domain-containing protein [Phycisphaeraceae bacterium]
MMKELDLAKGRLIGVMLAGMLLAVPASGGEEEWGCCRFDPDHRPTQMTEYGRLNFPPPLHADFEHMRLYLRIEDMNTPKMDAKSHLWFSPVSNDLTELTLDARLLGINSVEAPGYATTYTYDGAVLSVKFDPPVPVGTRTEVITTYQIVDPPYGLTWTPESPAFPGRAAELHTQGQPETNSYWFPCHDFPNDRLTTELIVTSPQGYQVLSNGRLVSKDREIVRKIDQNGEHRLQWFDQWHWAQDDEAGGGHVPYLVTLVVGKFDIVDVGDKTLSMPVYVPKGRGGDAEGTYGRTMAMNRHFEFLFDEPYPWSKYAQVVVWNFGAGGMENTSATTMHDGALFHADALLDHDLDGLISHELAHQWFGDLITCNSWEHIWLNEGFATYLTALWFEKRDGQAGYHASIRSNFDSVIGADRGTAPATPGMASKIYDHPWEVFRRGSNPYPKGASVLHMLRRKLGDRVFFKAVAQYVDEYKHKTVETDDFRRVLEAVSGESLEQFFAQWVYRPGIPRLDISTRWDESTSELVISLRQTQTIDEYNPAFAFELPVWVRVPKQRGFGTVERRIAMDSREISVRWALDARPDMVVFDPDLHVLAELKITQADSLWLEQLAHGPTLAAKIQAARAMAHADGKAAGRLAYAIALDRNAPERLRVEAVRSLEAQGDISRVFFLVPEGNRFAIDNYAVREAAASALGRMGYDHEVGSTGKAREQIAAALTDLAMYDTSTKVRAAAIRGLGTMRAVSAGDLVIGALDMDSEQDAVRRAALDAIEDLNIPAALPAVQRLCEPGTHSRTRPMAIRTAASMYAHDPEGVKATLARALFDREQRTRDTAAREISDIGGPWAVELLTRRLASLKDPLDQGRMQQLITKAEK